MAHKLETLHKEIIGVRAGAKIAHLISLQRAVNLDRPKVRTRTMAFMNTVEEIVTNEIGWKLKSALALFQLSLQEHPQTRRYTQRWDERKMKFEWNEFREGSHCVLGELQRDRARKST